MKPGLHPEYYRAKVTCACGAVYETGSTKPALRVDICSACHPFYTGKQKLVDTGGRVERFMKKYQRAQEERERKAAAAREKAEARERSEALEPVGAAAE